MRILRCLPLELLFNSFAKVLGDEARRMDGKIVSAHLSPLLTVVIKTYFRRKLTELAELEEGKVVLRSDRVARQYVYEIIACAVKFKERGEVCPTFRMAFDLPERLLSELSVSEELLEVLRKAEEKERELERRAEEIAREHGKKYEKWSEAYEVARGLVRPRNCFEKVLISLVAKKLLKSRKVDKEGIKEAVLKGDWSKLPPCMKSILESIARGENVSHFARFALAAYLLNFLGLSVDEVIGVFSRVADFDERKTRYQLEHIAGLRGGGKKYRVPNCEKMKLMGLCIADCGVRNPTQFSSKFE